MTRERRERARSHDHFRRLRAFGHDRIAREGAGGSPLGRRGDGLPRHARIHPSSDARSAISVFCFGASVCATRSVTNRLSPPSPWRRRRNGTRRSVRKDRHRLRRVRIGKSMPPLFAGMVNFEDVSSACEGRGNTSSPWCEAASACPHRAEGCRPRRSPPRRPSSRRGLRSGVRAERRRLVGDAKVGWDERSFRHGDNRERRRKATAPSLPRRRHHLAPKR